MPGYGHCPYGHFPYGKGCTFIFDQAIYKIDTELVAIFTFDAMNQIAVYRADSSQRASYDSIEAVERASIYAIEVFLG